MSACRMYAPLFIYSLTSSPLKPPAEVYFSAVAAGILTVAAGASAGVGADVEGVVVGVFERPLVQAFARG